jgi:hypothetical protein
MNESSSRPLVRKSSPAPIARALDSNLAVRPLSPLRRAAGSLAVAAAVVLAAGGSVALAGCTETATAKHEDRSGRDRSSNDERRTDRDVKDSGSAFDQLVNAVGDFVDPPTKQVDAIPPSSEVPRPAGTMSPISPTASPPRPAGSAASVPASPPPSPKHVGMGIGS